MAQSCPMDQSEGEIPRYLGSWATRKVFLIRKVLWKLTKNGSQRLPFKKKYLKNLNIRQIFHKIWKMKMAWQTLQIIWKPQKLSGKIARNSVKMDMVIEYFRKFYNNWKYLEYFPGNLEKLKIVFSALQIIWKVCGYSGKFTNTLRTLQIFLKISKHSGKFPDTLESFWTLWKDSWNSGNFLDNLESLRTLWEFSIYSGKFQDTVGNFKIIWKLFR